MFGNMACPLSLHKNLKAIERGFDRGLKPKLTYDGTSGTYMLRDEDRKIQAVFKPIDEEAFAPNNPRDHIGPFGSPSFRAGVLSGEACIREVAAYLLDKDGFSGVPPTTMVEVTHDGFKKFKFNNIKII
jgi:phosphatidylinositol 4-kinase type 2